MSTCLKEYAAIPVYFYALAKNVLKRVDYIKEHRPIYIIASAVLTLLLWIFYLATFLIFFLYFQIIRIVLFQKLKSKFFCLMDGADAFWCLNDNSRSIINILLILETNRSVEELQQIAHDTFVPMALNHPKIQCTYERFAGYWYFKQAYLQFDQLFQLIDGYHEVDEFKHLLGELVNAPMPAGDKALWQVMLGSKSLHWQHKLKKHRKQYPILIRFHHSVGDGVAILNLLISYFMHNGTIVLRKYLNQFNKTMQTNHVNKVNSVQCQQKDLYLKHMAILDGADCDLVKRKVLSGRKFVSYFSEKDGTVSAKTYAIRRKYNLSFTKFMLTLVGYSLEKFYEEHRKFKHEYPNHLLACITSVFKTFKFDDHITFNFDGDPIVNLQNHFSMGIFKMPINNYCHSHGHQIDIKHFLNKFDEIGSELDSLNNSLDFKMNYWAIKCLATYIPYAILNRYVDFHSNSFGITNLPGIDQLLSASEDLAVVDMIHWIPNFKSTGLGLTMSRYCGNLKLTFIADRVIMNRQEVVDEFLETMLDNIDHLHRSLESQ